MIYDLHEQRVLELCLIVCIIDLASTSKHGLLQMRKTKQHTESSVRRLGNLGPTISPSPSFEFGQPGHLSPVGAETHRRESSNKIVTEI
jgi:hypothetical protein